MGGLGSTRWHGYRKKPLVQTCLAVIEAHAVARHREQTQTFWTITTEPGEARWLAITATVEPARTGSRMRLQWHDRTQHIPLQTTRLPWGALRWWCTCPSCGRRCCKVYLPSLEDTFACRICHDLRYLSAQRAHKAALRPEAFVDHVRRSVEHLVREHKRICSG